MFTYPINRATDNWTVLPEAFEVARRQWEYSHAVNAVLTFAGFVAIRDRARDHGWREA
jgi:hypothetical protein